MNPSVEDLFGPPIHVYSRAMALADGAMVDVTATAREAGFRLPVALTRAAWALCVELSPAARRACNDERGRLWDVLWMAAMAARRHRGVSRLIYSILCVTRAVRASRVQLVAHIGPGDDGAPVLTIMLPGED